MPLTTIPTLSLAACAVLVHGLAQDSSIALQSASIHAPSANEPVRIALEYRGFRNFDLALPAERFAPIGAGFEIAHSGGERFEVRPEGTNLLVDVRGDGSFEGKVEPPEAGAVAVVTLRGVAPDGEPLAYMARVRVGAAGWEYSVSGALVGNLGDTKFVLVDQDLDGVYGEVADDALLVGRGKRASSHSATILLDDRLMDVSLEGRELVLVPHTGATGTLDLCSGFETKARVASMQVANAERTVFLDLARYEQGARVPVGTYTFVAGHLSQGENSVSIAPGKLARLDVKADALTRLEWGGPIRGEFSYQNSGRDYAFTPDAVWYFGRGGEQYVAWTPLGASPRFVVVDQDTGAELVSGVFPGT